MDQNLVVRKERMWPWVICAGSVLVFFTSIGLTPGTFSAHAPFMIDEWGMTNTQNSTIVSVRTFAGLIAIYLCGVYYNKLFSLRVGMTIGVVLGGIGFFVFSVADSFAMGCVAACFTGACYGFAGSVPVSIIIANWFNKRRVTAMSIAFASSGIAAWIVPPIVSRLIVATSLSNAFIIEGCVIIGIAIVAFLLLRNDPADVGVEPLGGKDLIEAEKESKKVVEIFHPTKASQIIVYIVSFIIGAINFTAYNHFTVLYTTDGGWDPVTASGFLSMAGFGLLVGKLLGGWLADRFSARSTAFIFFGLTLAAMILAPALCSVENPIIPKVVMLIYGLGGILATTGISAYSLELSSKEDYPKVNRWAYVLYGVSSVICSYGMGYLADITGGYASSYYVLAVLTVIGFGLLQCAYKLSKPEKIQGEVM